MTQVWLYTIVSVFIVSSISLIGVLTISFNLERLKKILLFLVSFAAGSLLGGAFIHLLPEAYDEIENIEMIPYLILLGIVSFFIIEKILCWRHCHIPTSEEHPHPMAINNIIGDGAHNFIDGMIIAGSYLVSFPLGLATTVAVILHEIPQEIGDFGILLHAGFSRKKALFFNYLSAFTAVIGAVLTLMIGNSITKSNEFLIPFTIGGFIYIATADLIPELVKENKLGRSILQLLSLLAGIGIMALLLLIE
ncbi:MAG: ZIP family metal transporter [Candidatus Kerfeldbacteria bacterium CG_4_10_14_0_8_um_filter_42_10]|uniref:ZIP family metal transporter n=1 Tax=Candidatus Kerfeldbacteria bacterium CG_4_10_14_0_8_um_filter_42_10 TaxID=2014248 RepID=A0A2M7RJ40_9BACT|nr:MAG: ZIP family metal transporter [Candidatus Kerfeldbacteria bacterium CG_4_10_14_0_8_um_filter_42_10]